MLPAWTLVIVMMTGNGSVYQRSFADQTSCVAAYQTSLGEVHWSGGKVLQAFCHSQDGKTIKWIVQDGQTKP